MREVNVWGATHTDEWQSLALINGLRRAGRRNPGLPVHAFIPHSRKGGFQCRGEHNLNLAGLLTASGGIATPGTPYTRERARRIVKRSYGAYTNIDAHAIMDHGAHTAYIDIERGVSPVVLGFLKHLGITALVGTEGWGLQSRVKNSFMLESTYEYGDKRDKVIDALHRLATDPDHPIALAGEFNWYRFVGDLDDNTCMHRTRGSYDTYDGTDLKPLMQLPESVSKALGVGGVVRVLNWRDFPISGGKGVWGEAVTDMATPNMTAWPYYAEERKAAAKELIAA